MRVFKDLEMVEQMGSGVPRILENYGREFFSFSQNFLRMSFPKELEELDGGTPTGFCRDNQDPALLTFLLSSIALPTVQEY